MIISANSKTSYHNFLFYPVHHLPRRYYFFSLVNFEPSKVRLYIKPFWLKTNPTTGSLIFSVSMEAAAPRFIRATDPSTPAFQPELARNLARASSCIKTRMTSFFDCRVEIHMSQRQYCNNQQYFRSFSALPRRIHRQ